MCQPATVRPKSSWCGPWSELDAVCASGRYMVSEIQFGAWIMDEWDRRVVHVYADRLLADDGHALLADWFTGMIYALKWHLVTAWSLPARSALTSHVAPGFSHTCTYQTRPNACILSIIIDYMCDCCILVRVYTISR
jgi:hypothetical protein